MRVPILEERYRSSQLVTTADAARMLEVSRWTVRWFARQRQLLVYQTTRSGQRLFRKGDVERLSDQRREARLTGVKVLRPKKVGVPGEPQQLALFTAAPARKMAKAVLRLVARRAESPTEAWVQRA
jgi:hypothetical protein